MTSPLSLTAPSETRRPAGGLYSLLPIFLLLGAAVPAAEQRPPAPVVVAAVVESEVAAGQSFVGTVVPSKLAVVGSAVDGRVIEFPLNEGDRVERGQTLAQLLTETIGLEVAAAEAELQLRQQELAELENGSRPQELEQAKARMLASEAVMKYLQSRRARAEALWKRGQSTSEEELERAVSEGLAAEQSFQEAKATWELVVEGPRKEKIAQARAQVAMQQVIVGQLKDQLAKHTVISRFDGYVTAEHTEVGAWLKKGDPVAEVAALDEVEISVQVVEQHVAHLHLGTEVRVEVPALPDRVFTGTIARIVPQADVRARTFPVKVRVKNEITQGVPLLKSGMYCRVFLPTGPKQKALLVPKDALVLGGPKPVLFLVQGYSAKTPQGTVQPVPVELGIAVGQAVAITGPVTPGQYVVVQGNERLRPGQPVMVQKVVEVGLTSGPGSHKQAARQDQRP